MEYYENSFAAAQGECRESCIVTLYYIYPYEREKDYFDTREDAEETLTELRTMFPRINFQIKEETKTISI